MTYDTPEDLAAIYSLNPPNHGAMTMNTTEYEREAFELGVQHAKSAASWIADGNTKTEFIPAVLQMFEDGDPAVYDYLPYWPNLSGEWADNPTPLSLAREISGDEDPDEDLINALADAYECGVDETFEDACITELKRWLS